MTKVEVSIASATLDVEVHKEARVPKVQKEIEMALGKSATSSQEQMDLVLQNP